MMMQRANPICPAHPSPRRRVPPVVPVSRFVADTRMLLERDVGLTWISGEISGCTRAASGHCYFTLKDASAQIRCVFFRHKAQGLAFALREGLAVEVRAVPTIYERARRIAAQRGDGTPRGARSAVRAVRADEGNARSRGAGSQRRASAPLPPFPRRIGIVTSPHAAALRDVLTTLARRLRRLPRDPVSGVRAGRRRRRARSRAAIRAANAHASVDVLIVCRGGGSLEDLWAFNEEVVARAVFESALPVVSGVGHETDFTICDFVADVRAPTPTAAAALVVPRTRIALSGSCTTAGAASPAPHAHHALAVARSGSTLPRAGSSIPRPVSPSRQGRSRAGDRGSRARSRHGAGARARPARAAARAAGSRTARPLPQATRVLQRRARDAARGGERIAVASRAIERLARPRSHSESRSGARPRLRDRHRQRRPIVADARMLKRGDRVALTFARVARMPR